jgi:hypothetical protein
MLINVIIIGDAWPVLFSSFKDAVVGLIRRTIAQ